MKIGSVKVQQSLEFQQRRRLGTILLPSNTMKSQTIQVHHVQHIYCCVKTPSKKTISACEVGSKRQARALDVIYLCAEQKVY